MHTSAMQNSARFFAAYSEYFKKKRGKIKVVEIGSQDVNGSIREVCPPEFEYLGLDFVEGKGVDVILDDPYSLPLEDETVDILVTSSCFEHSEMFWVVFLEIIRVLKKDGLVFITAPSNGMRHSFPVDCWRFYPDAGYALVTWANRNGYSASLLESYTSAQDATLSILSQWNDFVAVIAKDASSVKKHPNRIVDTFTGYTNAYRHGSNDVLKPNEPTEDQRKFIAIANILNGNLGIEQFFEGFNGMSQDQQKLIVISKIISNELTCL